MADSAVLGTNPFVSMPPDAVRKAAHVIARPHDPRIHWTQVATLLGAVEDRQLYEAWSFRSTRAWAERELDVSPSDTLEFLRLYRLVQRSGRPLDDWARVSKGKARLLVRALHLGGDPTQWLELALASETEEALREILQRQLGKDVFVPYTVYIPESLEPLVREAMRRALTVAIEEDLPDDPDAQDALVLRRDTHFRCLEVICGSFLLADGVEKEQ